MARFRFKLEAVLKMRRHVEQEKQRQLAELHRERIALEDVLRLHQQQIDASRGSMREDLVGKINPWELGSHTAATLRLMAKAQGLAVELAGVHQRIEAARQELLEAKREVRAIELLREKRFAQWKAALDQAESNMLDELAVMAAARNDGDTEVMR